MKKRVFSLLIAVTMLLSLFTTVAYATGGEATATGTITPVYTRGNGFWGEGGGNASESLVVELYEGDTKIASASLNNVGGIIDGDVYVTWSIPFAGSTDEYWTVEWTEGYPKYDMAPTKGVMVIDGTAVAESAVQYNAPDNLNKIVALAEGYTGGVVAYTSLTDAIGKFNGRKVNVLRDVTESIEGFYGCTLTTNVESGVTITSTYEDWIDATDLNVGSNVSVVGGGIFFDGSASTIEGTVHITDTHYHGYDATVIIQNGGNMIVDGAAHIRYNEDADAGLYIYGDNDDSTVELDIAYYLGAYSGTFYAEDANVEVGYMLLNGETDGEGNAAVSMALNNSTFKTTGTTDGQKQFNTNGDASITLTNGSKVEVLGAFNATETVKVSMDATSSFTAGGANVFVAEVNGTPYATLAEALRAAQNGDTIELLYTEGDAPISMAGSLHGNKIVTITGTAEVDWSQGWLFVGRGGEGDGTLIFEDATLTSDETSLANGSFGIHVSAPEKDAADKNTGKVIFKNSDVQLSYLANRSNVEVDGGKLYVHYGFWVGGRPASETPDGTAGTATMDIKNDAVVEVKNHNGMGIGYESKGVLNVDGATFNYTGTSLNVAEGSAIAVSGESTIAATVTGSGWVYMNGVTLDADTKLLGAKVRFASGTNTVDGSTIDDGFFQVGIGAYNGVDANVDTTNGVTVNVKNAVIGSNGSTYAGWIGTGFYDTDDEKAAVMTGAKYVLNIENSTAAFGYLHVSNDGELNVTGNATEKTWYNNSDYSFYAGDFIINGTATFDATDVLALYTKVSCDNGTTTPGTLNIVNGTEYEAERHNGAIAGTNFVLYKTGVVNVDNAELYVGEYSTIAADAKLNVTDATVTVMGTVTNNGTISMDANSKITTNDITGDGKVAIDTTGFTGNKTVIDINNESTTLTNAKITVGDVTIKRGDDGDVMLVNVGSVESGTLYVNADWTSQDAIDAILGKYSGYTYGTNVFATLDAAIAAVGDGDVVIELLADATLDYNAREAYGTAETTSLTINGNGYTLTLNQKDSDWSSIGLANADAKLVMNDMTIEKTGYGDTSGAWNTHAIIFTSALEMTDVTVNNSMAVQAGATLNEVTINEANGYYGLWVNGNGQTVTVNGGTINATNGGRGIKIADEYVDTVKQVTLNVTGTTFNTAKKAAVLVSSTAGAKVTASGVDISNVAEDTVNFVWVDEDWAAYYNNVKVSGEATKTQENEESFPIKVWYVNGEGVATSVRAYYKTLDELFAAPATQVPGSNYIDLSGDVEAANQVNVSYGSNRVYTFGTSVEGGVTMDFKYADNWNMLPKFDLGENITMNVPYLQVIGGDIEIAGTLNTTYLYLYGTGEGVTITETGVVNANTGDATVQVKGGTVLTVNGELNTGTLNVWTEDVNNSELIVSGENAEVNASNLHAWNGEDGVSAQKVVVKNGATLTATDFQADRGSEVTVDAATLTADSLTLGYEGNIGTLTVLNNGVITNGVSLNSTGSTVIGPKGMNVTSGVDGYKVAYADGVYSLVKKDSVAMTNGIGYDTLKTAIANTADGGTITLLDTSTEEITVSKALTIELNGFTAENVTPADDYVVDTSDATKMVFGPVKPATAVTLDKTTASLTVGDTVTLTATVEPADSTDKTVTWTSSDESVATVDENGVVTAVAAGRATITATAGDKTATCTVTVTRASSDGGSYNPSYTITVEDADNGSIKVSPAHASKGTTVTITVDPDEGYELDELVVLDKNGKEIKLTRKSDGEYTFKMPSGKVTIEATFVEVVIENPFVDVPDNAYYTEAVLWAVENEITNGTSAVTFSPDAVCTRAQVVTFLWRAAGSPEPVSTVMPFTDVAEGAYYYDAVLWAVENAITNGTSATTFSPDADCTRGQIVTFLWRSQGSEDASAYNPFVDVANDAYYTEAVLWAVENGITNGTSATTFSPDADCTRGQIVTFLYRCLAE